jgi:signal transduction histidine kinase
MTFHEPQGRPQIDTSALAERYRQALKGYVTTGAEDALHHAYELGREALEADLGPLILFSLHRDAVQQLPSHDVDPDEFVANVTRVLVEALAPFQMISTSLDEAEAVVIDVGSLLERQLRELKGLSEGLGTLEDPHFAEIALLLERHAADVDGVRDRLENVGGSAVSRREVISDIVHAQEEERRRLAGDIHDDAVQAMTVVLLRIGLLGARLEKAEDVTMIEELEGSVRDTIGRLRRLIAGLAPQELDRAGLGSAIRSALNATKDEFAIDFVLANELEVEPGIEARTIAYRILQEALANARKHARSSKLEVLLKSEGGGVLGCLSDDGGGFDVEAALAQVRPGHLGLAAMRERAALAGGWLKVHSGQGGTTVQFWIPDKASAAVKPKAEAD